MLMKKNWPYILFIPALFASYYLGSQSEKSFQKEYLSRLEKIEKEDISKKNLHQKKEILKKQVSILRDHASKKDHVDPKADQKTFPVLNKKEFIQHKRKDLAHIPDAFSGGEDNRDQIDGDLDKELEVSSVLDEVDQELLRELASEMPEAAEELQEIFKDKKVKRDDALKDTIDRESTDPSIAPLNDSEL